MDKIVLFDLDGTILDSSYDLMNAINYGITSIGEKALSNDAIKLNTGSGIRALVANSITDGFNNPRYEEGFNLFKLYYSEHAVDSTVKYDRIDEVIDGVLKKGYRIGVVSNKADELAKKVVNHFFGEKFEVVVGAMEGVPIKPDKAEVEYALNKLGYKDGTVYFVGDGYSDYQTAINSGCIPVMVTYGFRNREFLENKGVKDLIDTPIEILDKIK